MLNLNSKTTILIISNGETEDYLACQIIDKLPKEKFEFVAAPLVSHGKAFSKRGIQIICPTLILPSRGFNNQSFKALWQDLKSGLGSLTIRQILSLRKKKKQYDYVFTCGDVLPQFFGFLTGKPFLSFFTALSEFYIRDNKGLYSKFWKTLEEKKIWRSSTFTIFDRALMHSSRCLGVFVRDDFTQKHLQSFTEKSFSLGNPMMDGFKKSKTIPVFNSKNKTIVLLPGSRTPEVYENLKQMIGVLSGLGKKEYNIALNLTAHMTYEECFALVKHSPIKIHILEKSFEALLNQADLALAMCGTAAEQAIGRGIPVVSIPGKGPQFIPAFAKRQKDLLGSSYFLIETGLKETIKQVEVLLKEKRDYRENALERMGKPGGSQRIANKLEEMISEYSRIQGV